LRDVQQRLLLLLLEENVDNAELDIGAPDSYRPDNDGRVLPATS